MTPPPAARARATKSGSALRKQNSAMAGTLERNISTAVPEGEMSSVETLSPSLMSTGALRRSSVGRPRGTGLMLGPLRTSTPAASDGDSGGISPASEASSVAGQCRSGGVPALRGSLMRPVRAETAAVSGEQR